MLGTRYITSSCTAPCDRVWIGCGVLRRTHVWPNVHVFVVFRSITPSRSPVAALSSHHVAVAGARDRLSRLATLFAGALFAILLFMVFARFCTSDSCVVSAVHHGWRRRRRGVAMRSRGLLVSS